MVVVCNLGVHDPGILRAGVEQELLDLVAADVAQDAAVLFLFKEPGRARGRAQAVRPHADDLHHAADGSGLDELAGVNGAFHLQPFAVIYKVFSACFRDGFLYVGELLKCGERRFVGE